MTPPAILPDLPPQALIDAVKYTANDSEYKARIMLLRDLGAITDDEAEDWISVAGVRGA